MAMHRMKFEGNDMSNCTRRWVIMFINSLLIAVAMSSENVSRKSLPDSSPKSPKLITKTRYSFHCWTDEGGLLNFPDEYSLRTCAFCYDLLPSYVFSSPQDKLEYRNGLLWRTEIVNGTKKYVDVFYADYQNISSPIYRTFKRKDDSYKWIECCEEAFNCCAKMLQDPVTKSENSSCQRTWDGWSCVSDTQAGTTISLECPDYIYFASKPPACKKYATRYCNEEAEWKSYKNDKLSTNYVSCAPVQDLLERLHVSSGAFSLTIVGLIPAITIIHRQVQSPRIRLHKHFFISLLLNAVAVVTFRSVLASHVNDSSTSLISENGVGCKILLLLTKYFRMTNYMWMFCEGYYLHKLIASAFAEQNSLIPFYIIGWGCPMLVVTAYGVVRTFEFNTPCWAHLAGLYEWIINGPSLFCLAINLVFLCNIIRILWSKVRARYVNEPSHFRKTAKATMVLLPLFGLHFVFVLNRPQNNGECILSKIHYFVYYIIDGTQGLVVACIYCYMNSEVQTALKRSYTTFRQSLADRKNNRRMLSSRTQSFSTNNTSLVENHSHHVKNPLK